MLARLLPEGASEKRHLAGTRGFKGAVAIEVLGFDVLLGCSERAVKLEAWLVGAAAVRLLLDRKQTQDVTDRLLLQRFGRRLVLGWSRVGGRDSLVALLRLLGLLATEEVVVGGDFGSLGQARSSATSGRSLLGCDDV